MAALLPPCQLFYHEEWRFFIVAIKTLKAVRAICECSDWEVSNLKVQKILYLCHRFYMGQHSEDESHLKPLIKKDFYAWAYGPVVPEVYRKLKMFGADDVEPTYALMNEAPLDEESPEYKVINAVCSAAMEISASELVAITHKKGGAWDKYYQPHQEGVIIPNKAIYAEYAARYK